MSSTTAPSPPTPPPATQFPYGFRYRVQPQADGTLSTLVVPLTLEDLLHPEEDDQVTHATPHERDSVYLFDVFAAQVAGQPTTVVLKDVRIDWGTPEPKPHGPDLMIIAGVTAGKNWSTFYVGLEGVRPSLIVEITSPETRTIDLSDKLREYEQAEVPLYIIVDRATERTPMRLLGYERVDGRYRELAADARGFLWLAPVGVWLGVLDDRAVCFDEQGTRIPDYTAQRAAQTAAEQQAAAEARARAAAEQQAAAAEARAAAADQARTAAEARVRELEALVRRLRGEADAPPRV